MLAKLVKLMKVKNLSLSLAESASAGYLSYLITKTPGSSKIFKGGVVAYSFLAKNKLLNLPMPLLKKTNGVSSQVALALAKNIRNKLKSSLGASIVGFAGPDVKKGFKPGTFFIAVADKKSCRIKKIIVKGSRNAARRKASETAIKLIYAKVKTL